MSWEAIERVSSGIIQAVNNILLRAWRDWTGSGWSRCALFCLQEATVGVVVVVTTGCLG